jgi:hypothetical protein
MISKGLLVLATSWRRGSKSFMAPEIAAQITELDNATIREIAAVLIKAKTKTTTGELKLMHSQNTLATDGRKPRQLLL